MDRFREMKVFVAVAETGGLAKAAAKLRSSPPAVTRTPLITVPAGAYTTTHVDELASAGEARWYTPDIGMAQLNYLHGGAATYRLVSHNMAVGIEKTSWSNLKAAYR